MIKLLRGVIKLNDNNQLIIGYVHWDDSTKASYKEAVILGNQTDYANTIISDNVMFLEKDGIAKILTDEEIINSIKFE